MLECRIQSQVQTNDMQFGSCKAKEQQIYVIFINTAVKRVHLAENKQFYLAFVDLEKVLECQRKLSDGH